MIYAKQSVQAEIGSKMAAVFLVPVILHLPHLCMLSFFPTSPAPEMQPENSAPPRLFAFCLLLSPASGQHRERGDREMEKLEVMWQFTPFLPI